jgi:hypothetical protein
MPKKHALGFTNGEDHRVRGRHGGLWFTLVDASRVPLPCTLKVRLSIFLLLVTEKPLTSAILTRNSCLNAPGGT